MQEEDYGLHDAYLSAILPWLSAERQDHNLEDTDGDGKADKHTVFAEIIPAARFCLW